MKVLFVYRSKKLNLFSIEKHFQLVQKYLHDVDIQRVYLPYPKSDIFSIIGNLIFLKKYINNREYDIYHVTGHIHYVTLVLPPKKTILTVHDLGGIEIYKGIKKIIFKYLYARLPFKKCKVIATISEKSKQEILEINNKLSDIIRIVPAPIEDGIERNIFKPNDTEQILMIGTANNKNHLRVLSALKGSNYKFIIVGDIPDSERELLELNKFNYENLINISDEEIIKLYKTCDLVLFASTYEGFGAIITEAQKYGCPVVTSDIEPMKSVAGGGAVLVDPYDEQDIKCKVEYLLSNLEYRNRLREKGYINVSRFFASKIATDYMNIYNEMLKK